MLPKREELLREKRIWQELETNEGWKMLCDLLLPQLNDRAHNILLNPNIEERQREFLRGELALGMYILDIPSMCIEASSEALKALAEEEDNGER